MISTSSKDLEFLLSVKPEPLENYLKLVSAEEKEQIIRWRTTRDVPVGDIMKLSLVVKNLKKALKTPAKSEKIEDFAPIQAEKFWIDQAREKVDFFMEYVSGKTPATHHKYWLAHIFNPAYPFVNIISPPGAAKAQPLDAKIVTPAGWRKMGDLQVGDYVISVDGCPTQVTGVFPQGVKDIYRVTFRDGSSTECTDDHLWTARMQGAKDGGRLRTMPLSNFRENLVDNQGKPRWHIPITAPVEYPEQDFYITPYIMGVILGDGTVASGDCRISCDDVPILERVVAELPEGFKLKHTSGYDYAIRRSEKGTGRYNGFLTVLGDLGLRGVNSLTKFIPQPYLRGSIAERIALLQGLMDTDGTLRKRAACSPVFCTISPQLRDDVIELVQSLGGIATYSIGHTTYEYGGEIRQGKESYKVTIKLPAGIPLFYLPRKAELYTAPTKYQPTRAIVKVELVGQKEAQCIKVAHESELYLTDDYIVTHNTHCLIYSLAYVMGYDPLTTNSLITVSSTQAEDRMEMLKEIVTENRAYKNVFPEIEVNPKFPNNTEEFSLRIKEQYMAYDAWSTLRQQKGEPHDPTFKSVGYGGKSVIGSRWSGLMGIDDIVDESMSTPDQQKKVGKYIVNTLMGRLVPRRGRGVVIGNRWMVGDVPEQLKNNPRWFTIETPAWRIDGEGTKRSYWPEYFSIEDLEAIKEGMLEYPGLFETTYLLNAQAASIQLFTEILLSRDVPDLQSLPKFKGIYITTDFALGIEQRNDWTVFQAVGLDFEGNYYILDQRRVKETDDDSPDTLVEFVDYVAWTYGRMDMIYVEKVAFSGTMGTLLMKTRKGLPVQKIVPIGNKGHRAALVSSLAKRGQLFINQSMQDIGQLKTEWMNFGMYPHDDTLDPMGLILQAHGMSTVTATYSTVKSPYLY